MAGADLQVVQPSTQIARPETFAPRNIQEAMKFAELLLESGMLPKSYAGKNAATIVVALQFGMELGMQPMQSLQNIANINGQPGVWGDAALALVLSSGLCEYYQEDDFETIKKNKKATFIVKRRGFPKEKVTTFSYEDAQTAGIFTNAVWKTYPFRMCQMRARSFGLRDSFPDVLKGLPLAEELQDYPGTTIDGPVSSSASTPSTTAPKAEETIGQPGGSEFYREYKASGWTPDESKDFIYETFHLGHPSTCGLNLKGDEHKERKVCSCQSVKFPHSAATNSKDIPVSRKVEALAWARTAAPIKLAVNEKFEKLGWTEQEKKDCFLRLKDFVAVDKELAETIEKLNAQEQ